MFGKSKQADWKIEPLGAHHDRSEFRCGVPELDAYLQQQAGQDQKRKLAAIFVLVNRQVVGGYYTLSAHSILATDLPEDMARKLPRFPLPVTLLGRMAVAESRHGSGLGKSLLVDALQRAFLGSRQVASWAVIVDAKIEARNFYLKYGFIPLPNRPSRLFLPMKTIEKIF